MKSPSLEVFQKALASERSLLIEELWDSPKACLIELAQKATGKNILVITGEARESRLLDDLPYFGVRDAEEFPSWETLPGEEIPPSSDIVGRRLEILRSLLSKKGPRTLLCSLQACLQKTPSKKALKPLLKELKVGDELSFEEFSSFLTSIGYKRATVVSDKGEFAIRGGLIDLYPVTSLHPYRLDFFGDTLESIRIFDAGSQKSVSKVETLSLSPASEWELLKSETAPSTIFDFLGPNTIVIFDDLLAIEDRYVAFKNMPGSASRYFSTFDELIKITSSLQQLFWSKERIEELSEVQVKKRPGRDYYTGKEPFQELHFSIFGDHKITTKRWQHPFQEVSTFFSPGENSASLTIEELLQTNARGYRFNLHFLSATASEERLFKEKLAKDEIPIPSNAHFELNYLSSGFVLPDSNLAIVPMTEFTHRLRIRRQKWRSISHTPPSEFHSLAPGDVVVHFHQGIGKFLGTEKRLNHVGQETEFLALEYAENSKLYVPISQSHLVSRYIGAKEEIPTFSTLGTTRWQKTRMHAQKAIIGYAQDLLRLNAEREIAGGYCFPPDGDEMISFEQDFPFDETEDQLNAIDALKKDMLSSKAMDRLICGDVGYGKTEVAMRAAFKAVADGKKQVVVLVPTTVLALQHYETFAARMANYPINIAHLSRFSTAKDAKETLKKVSEGSIDILVGTHRVLSKDIKFKDLGLIIIDEEQRFGVRAKEHLKHLKAGVDCLTLTATPIPRTLYLTLIGAREISTINTPPQDRLPIKTIIIERESSTIHNALLRELSRDGQAFFIHNRVETIFNVTDEIQKLLPQAQIVTGHGGMSSDELDTVFHAFKKGSADILVATTIVENGVDIPNANTIIIDRADTFGLADLYQLRGRVGRWNRPAYAYFLVPKQRELSELSRKRLHALVESSGFGGGMKIAMRDLEIRGAGDILGTEQSGQVSAIGFHLYCKLLKRTVDALKNKSAPAFYETKMEFPFKALFPEEYIAEPSLRMELYHRMGEATSPSEVDAILEEIKDRFGPPPPEVLWLYHLARLRLFASLHQFLLLKFETRTLYAERQTANEVEKKRILYKESKNPAALEAEIIALLRHDFSLK
ncbi:MAG: transcription-repair coupling factor [Chlamydiales bacterium]|nr:transcription-repair coupling factor [Chlamydiales bacterium]